MVRASGTTTTITNSDSAAPGSSAVHVTHTGSKPIFALGGSWRGHMMNMTKVGSTYSWVWIVNKPVGTVLPYWIFDDTIDVYTNIGLEIYDDAAGLPILFSSDPTFKPLRVVDSLTALGLESYSAGRTYAISQGKFAGYRQWEAGAKNFSHLADPDFYAMIAYAEVVALVNTGTPTVELIGGVDAFRLDPPPSSFDPGDPTPDYSLERNWTQRQVLVLDVTGY